MYTKNPIIDVLLEEKKEFALNGKTNITVFWADKMSVVIDHLTEKINIRDLILYLTVLEFCSKKYRESKKVN